MYILSLFSQFPQVEKKIFKEIMEEITFKMIIL